MAEARVLVAALDWGWGHATRTIPVVHQLLQEGAPVILGGSGSSGALLKEQFPTLPFAELPAYNPRYGPKGMSVARLLGQAPHFASAILNEKVNVAALAKDWGINRIISDNRYGCYSKNAKSAIICHQLSPALPSGWTWASPVARRINGRLLAQFDEVWVPDNEGDRSLTGQLSVGSHKRIRYVGPLSRMKPGIRTTNYAVTGVVSGPEPLRSVFENALRREFATLRAATLLVKGIKTSVPEWSIDGTHEEVSYLAAAELNERILQSATVVCRAGYSSVMDMSCVGGRVIFVPTPDQPEQQYLAKRLNSQNIALAVSQDNMNIEANIRRVQETKGFVPAPVNTNLNHVIRDFL